MIKAVELTERAKKDIRSIPAHIQNKLFGWIIAVEQLGLETVRLSPGYHDEPLKGKRFGQRSIRLNRA